MSASRTPHRPAVLSTRSVGPHPVRRTAHHPTLLSPPPNGGPYASFDDVDFEAVVADLDELRPGFALAQKRLIASWSVLYYVLM